MHVVTDAENEEKEADYGYDNGRKASRMLGASPDISDEHTAAVFSGGLSIVLISLEIMCLTHSGIKRALEHLVHRSNREEHGNTVMPHWPAVTIALFKVGIFLFTMTLSRWTNDPAVLAFCGFCVVVLLSICRILNYASIRRHEAIQNLQNWLEESQGEMRTADGTEVV